MEHKKPKEMDTKFRDNVKEKAENFANETTLHGVKNTFILKNSLWKRGLWLVTLIGMVIFSVMMISESILKYLDYDTITIVRQTVHDNLPLPYISFCNFNFPRKHILLERYPDVEEFKNLYDQYLVNQFTADTSLDAQYTEARANMSDRLRNITIHEYYSNVGYSVDETIVDCMFGLYINSFDCQSYVTQFRNPNYGMCNTFHYGSAVRENIMETGYNGGITMVLNVFPEEYSSESSGPTRGYVVFVHESEYPDLGDPVAISTGSHSFIGLKKHKQSILPKPYAESNCVDTRNYNRLACLEKCNNLAEWTSEPNCSCDIYLSEGERACTMYDLFFCVWTYQFNNYLENNRASQAEQCDCPHPCDVVHYDQVVSTVSLSSPQVNFRARVDNWPHQNATEIEDNYVSLLVYFRSFTETHTLEKPAMEIYDVFANIGGQLGLCVGASLITIVEFLELLAILVYNVLRFMFKGFNKSGVVPTKQAYSETK